MLLFCEVCFGVHFENLIVLYDFLSHFSLEIGLFFAVNFIVAIFHVK